MSKKDKIIVSAASAFLFLLSSQASSGEAPRERCYGISKAGKNDCSTAKSSCSGSATKDNQGDAFLFVPKGLCDKIVGGSLKAKTDAVDAASPTAPSKE